MDSSCIAYYVRCRCDLDGKINGKWCPDCDGWGVLYEELPLRPDYTRPGQIGLPLEPVREQR